jgi:hypothetical protein
LPISTLVPDPKFRSRGPINPLARMETPNNLNHGLAFNFFDFKDLYCESTLKKLKARFLLLNTAGRAPALTGSG